ncbi:MAG: response regulator [Gorillibacterium sp.]|nr:response regulator [Gorillibacterium sp.]
MYKVLLVDDEPRSIEGLQIMIDWHKLGFEICGVCTNGVEALAKIKETAPDLVITDIQMPVMNGLELIAAIKRSSTQPIIFIILSAYNEFNYAKKAMEYGIRHYILKPIIEEEASALLREVYLELSQASGWQELQPIVRKESIASQLAGFLYGYETDEMLVSREIRELVGRNNGWCFALVEADPGHRQTLRETVRHYLGDEDDIYMIDQGMDAFGIVFGLSHPISFDQRIAELSNLLVTKYTAGFTIAVGRRVPDLFTLDEAYQTAREAMSFTFFNRGAGVVYYQDIESKKMSYRSKPLVYAREALERMERLDLVGLQAALEAAHQEFQATLAIPELVRMFAVHLVYESMNLIKEMGGSPEELLKRHPIASLQQKGSQLNDIMLLLERYCADSLNLVSQLQKRQSQGLLTEINAYTHEHYRESLTLKELAERFYIHPVYLGQLFMKKNGRGFNAYIHDLRIEEAKQLTRQTDRKAHQIAADVGYLSYDKFLKQFEKRVGVKPHEYRKSLLDAKEQAF